MSLINQAESILTKFQAGKEAHTPVERAVVFKELNKLSTEIVENNALEQDTDLIQVLLNSFEAAVSNGFAFSDVQSLDPHEYYNLGKYLLDKNKLQTVQLDKLLHAYLNLFRHSGFLEKIYDQQRWPELIEQLIVSSNFTVQMLIKQRVKTYPQKSLFRVLEGNSDTKYTWKEINSRIHQFSLGLLSLSQQQSDEPLKIAFLVENSLNMVLLDLACLTSGIVNIMIPANSVPEQIEFILKQTSAGVVLLGNDKQLAKVKSIKSKLPSLKTGVLLTGSSIDEWVMNLDDLLLRGTAVGEERLIQSQNEIRSDQLATIMYTSGTTGVPKGIMFSQLNIVFKRFSRAMALPQIGQEDRFLSYLPLYHTFGRWLEMMGSIFWAAEYVFMENPAISTMLDNMERTHPTIFISIPKKWMQLYEHVSNNVNIEMDEEQKIRDFVHQASGGQLRWGLSAAGYLEPDVFRFFQRNGVHLMSGFGMTEATGGITMTDPDKYEDNSLGRPLPGIQVKLGDDGEMLIHGGYVMMGYYGMTGSQDPFQDGWFPTGDIMRQHEDGHYEIIDRKKEIYKNIKGETIAPQKIENLFRDFDYVKQVFLVGDHKSFNTVLIYPNFEHTDGVIKQMSTTEMKNYFSSVVVTVNKFLAPFERILDFRLTEREFDAAKGELTPKGTYKRRVIEKNFDPLIESMYEKNFISIHIDDFDIHVPNWFLREKGCLTSDLKVDENGISIAKYDIALTVRKIDQAGQLYQIGDFIYFCSKSFIDFQIFLANPFYWLGNRALIYFAGESIFQWYRLDAPDPDIRFSRLAADATITEQEINEFTQMKNGGEKSLFGLNLAVKHLLCNMDERILPAVEYLNVILSDDHLPIYPLTYELIQQPAYTRTLTARRELFKTGLGLFKGKEFEKYLSIYLNIDTDLIDEDLSSLIVKTRKGDDDLTAIHSLIKSELANIGFEDRLKHSTLHGLFNLLADFGIYHPTKYKRVRQLIVRYQLRSDYKSLPVLASQARTKLLAGFRNWLGVNQYVSVDIETGEEYQWKDVIIFEESITSRDQAVLLDAISNTSLLREAIFLFSGGNMVRLYDIPPGGVWISALNSADGKTAFRVSVQTRYQGSYNFVLNHSEQPVDEKVTSEMNWLIHAGAPAKGMRLLEDFGGFWRNYNLWTEDYYPGDTVQRFFQRTLRRDTEENQKRLYHIWPFFVRTAIAAHVNFWRRTGYKLELENKSIDNIVIPPHDYQMGMRIVSIAKRIESTSLSELMDRFCEGFVKATEEKYPFIKQEHVRFNIFAGILDSEGEENGLLLLKEALTDINQSCHEEIKSELTQFLDGVKQKGFIPRPMYFAIQRFHRWFHLSQDASLSAQAQSLNEMYDTYQLQLLEKKLPETRARFFLETVFKDSGAEINENISHIVRRQHKSALSHEEMLEAISNIQKEFDLTEKEEYFLSRLSYPHLKPTDSALLLASQSIADVVVSLEDYDGIPYLARKPVSPKEISRLHQLYLEANLPVNFSPEHRFLVAVSERGFVIGGLFYKALDEQTVYMEKIVVSSQLRRKGISDGLMNEFFNRLRDEKIQNVTTGFFRPEYFYRFGFKVERKYAGLVKDLTLAEK